MVSVNDARAHTKVDMNCVRRQPIEPSAANAVSPRPLQMSQSVFFVIFICVTTSKIWFALSQTRDGL
jgi:hypothetical protein